MSGYKDPDFQDRLALAQKARARALEKLADAPKLDEATIAKRKAAQEAREAAIAEKSAAKRAAIAQAKADKQAAAKAKAELKAVRDAKDAARKKGQGGARESFSKAVEGYGPDEGIRQRVHLSGSPHRRATDGSGRSQP